ncbi:MAG: hypothetical protein A2085_05965 [Gemmatimonadetes bacterium GWC2_71_10]|nr:MAG: hypothetical protein A2085_05965 [Gemmatimonadetes bacterium GWC2_71_10]
MSPWCRSLAAAIALAGAVRTGHAQLIEIRTAPVAIGDQFEIFPSQNFGMGSVTIAIRDSLRDPFTNPALGARIGRNGRFFSSPTMFSVSHGAGGGRTLPLGAMGSAGGWFGVLAGAIQQVDPSRPADPFFPVVPLRGTLDIVPQPAPTVSTPRGYGNNYLFGLMGRRLAAGLSLAGSVSWAGLHGVDGVDMLYAGSQSVDQRGSALDLRLGLLKEWRGGASLQAVMLHNRFAMTHDVNYLEAFWDPGRQTTDFRQRVERNLDRTNTWGAHVAYDRPFVAGWRIGAVATMNHMAHPKIPNYEIMSIPRDPGFSWAYNLGVGIANRNGDATFAVDAVLEPIWSHTWALDTAGARTIDNRFVFTNALVRVGLTHEFPSATPGRSSDIQLGIIVKSTDYRLDQLNLVERSARAQLEHWVEWTPTWGFTFRFPTLEFRYRGRSVNGTGRPGVQNGFPLFERATSVGMTVIAAPSGPMTLEEVKVVTHQISVALPLRRVSVVP